jgi:Fur family ferric uptake transcriptional regulator
MNIHYNVEEILSQLKEKGYRNTPQRKAIVEVVLSCKHHLNSEEIYLKVKETHKDIGLATVYRTLTMLDELNVIKKNNFDDGCIRYELNSQEHHHHHLICSKCGKVIEVMDDLLEDLEKRIETKFNFVIRDHNLKFYGLCSECSKDQ